MSCNRQWQGNREAVVRFSGRSLLPSKLLFFRGHPMAQEAKPLFPGIFARHDKAVGSRMKRFHHNGTQIVRIESVKLPVKMLLAHYPTLIQTLLCDHVPMLSGNPKLTLLRNWPVTKTCSHPTLFDLSDDELEKE